MNCQLVLEANETTDRLVPMILWALRHGVAVGLEQPMGSLLEKHPTYAPVLESKLTRHTIHGCRHG